MVRAVSGDQKQLILSSKAMNWTATNGNLPHQTLSIRISQIHFASLSNGPHK
jgi:hypothetical protein